MVLSKDCQQLPILGDAEKAATLRLGMAASAMAGDLVTTPAVRLRHPLSKALAALPQQLVMDLPTHCILTCLANHLASEPRHLCGLEYAHILIHNG
jgi:hypothetical protein